MAISSATEQHRSLPLANLQKAVGVESSHGYLDDLSEDKLHGPGLFPMVPSKSAGDVRKMGP